MKILFLLVFVVVCFRSLFNGRYRSNEARYYLMQLLIWLCNDFFKLKYLFLIISLQKCKRQLSQKCSERGSEHHVRTHINEPPCFDYCQNL